MMAGSPGGDAARPTILAHADAHVVLPTLGRPLLDRLQEVAGRAQRQALALQAALQLQQELTGASPLELQQPSGGPTEPPASPRASPPAAFAVHQQLLHHAMACHDTLAPAQTVALAAHLGLSEGRLLLQLIHLRSLVGGCPLPEPLRRPLPAAAPCLPLPWCCLPPCCWLPRHSPPSTRVPPAGLRLLAASRLPGRRGHSGSSPRTLAAPGGAAGPARARQHIAPVRQHAGPRGGGG
jgi:hypothetical protein